ncbi:hypothetical protein L1987_03528 [Smallanthus sonchifolius]|uniref:Uncharacterized protein n=1 Tax=Smallanthus sonchifolius TaxID=185202 RepID=A0ACB9KB15_9ASTR|nr:hypothetical protein L1987_03528 [Smallanthus sonchifolius]
MELLSMRIIYAAKFLKKSERKEPKFTDVAVIMKDVVCQFFESLDNAKKAIEALNGAVIGSKECFVGKAMKKVEQEKKKQRGLVIPLMGNYHGMHMNVSVAKSKEECVDT